MEARFQKAKIVLLENPYATKKEIAESIGITNATKRYSSQFGKGQTPANFIYEWIYRR